MFCYFSVSIAYIPKQVDNIEMTVTDVEERNLQKHTSILLRLSWSLLQHNHISSNVVPLLRVTETQKKYF